MKKEFSKDNWKKALDTFADMVKEKRYNAVRYEKWRKYNKLTDVVAVYEKNTIGIFSTQKESSTMVDFFLINDRSFGEYLYIFFFLTTKGEENMTVKDFAKTTAVANFDASIVATSSKTIAPTTITKVNDKEYINARVCVNDLPVIAYGFDTKADKCDIEMIAHSSVNNVIDTKADKCEVDCLASRVSVLEAEKKEKEDKNMKNFNFDFGPCTNDQCHVSMYGIAVKNAAGVYVSYNPDTKEIVDVDILNFEGAKYMYKIPVALNDIAVGDVIIHNRKPMFVIGLSTDGSNNLTCIDVCAGEQKTIVPTVSPFGFSFITKIVSLFNSMMTSTNTGNPFDNMWMLMLFNDNKGIDMKDILIMSMLNNKDGFNNMNPMMMMMLMDDSDNKKDYLMPLMLMSNNTMFSSSVKGQG